MLSHLSPRTRSILEVAFSKRPVLIGGQTIPPLEDGGIIALYAVAKNSRRLSDLVGLELATELLKAYAKTEKPAPESSAAPIKMSGSGQMFRLGKLRAVSFRGLAPAGEIWEYDFCSKSHLIWGPNGCGKSSLLGAITWCLTGYLFRDDCPPSPVEQIEIYTDDKKPAADGTRPDALTLMDGSGRNTSSNAEFYVEIGLNRPNDTGAIDQIWVRRHSANGLSASPDGVSWTPLDAIEAIGVDELDAELQLLMPARVSHLRFGKNPDLVRVFSQIVGLDDLLTIAEIAAKAATAATRETNRIQKQDIDPETLQLFTLLTSIDANASDKLKSIPSYTPLKNRKLTHSLIVDFKNDLSQHLALLSAQCAKDLGIAVPSESDPTYAEFKRQISQLPGHVQACLTALERPLPETFATSIGLNGIPQDRITQLNEAVKGLELEAISKIRERLQFSLAAKKIPNLPLLHLASDYFSRESDSCPTCTQSLEPVPEIRNQLVRLKEEGAKPHLQQTDADFERSLIAKLDAVIAQQLRTLSKLSFSDRILADWKSFKSAHVLGLLQTIAQSFDAKISAIAEKTQTTEQGHAAAHRGFSAREQIPAPAPSMIFASPNYQLPITVHPPPYFYLFQKSRKNS